MRQHAIAPVRSPTAKAIPVRQAPPKKPEPIPQARERPWTEAETVALRDAVAKGLSYGQIQRKIKYRTRNSIIGKIHRLGIREAMPASVRRERASQHINAKNFPSRSRKAETLSTAIDKIIPLPGASLDGLTARSCRWPIGDPKASTFGFCGCDRREGSSYCAAHAREAYQPEPIKRAKRIERLADVFGERAA